MMKKKPQKTKPYTAQTRFLARRNNLLSITSLGASKRWTEDLEARSAARKIAEKCAEDYRESEEKIRETLARIQKPN